jgi:uncharacterized protein (DUF4415 family)
LSAQLVLDIYNLRKDYKAVAQYAKSYQAHADSSTKAELSVLAQKALLKTLQEEEASAKSMSGEGKLEAMNAVGRKYMEFATSYPQSSHVDAALWAAIQNFAYVAAERNNSETYNVLKASFESLTSKYANSDHSPKAIELMGRLLAFRKMSRKELQDYAKFRSHWEAQWKKEPRESRGALGMLVYKLSADPDRKRLVKEFSGLPLTPDNRESFAYVQLDKIQALKEKIYGISLKNLKTLKANTQRKMDLLDHLKEDVTELVKLQIPAPALEALKILGDGYQHMAEAMRAAPIPKGLMGENLEKYKTIVFEAARDLDNKGREAHKLADEKAREIDLSAS